jgi:serine/threonine-protein kinase
MPFEPGKRVGDYEIVALIGTGGMGHVYRARNVISHRIEALKVLSPQLSADQTFTSRFLSEIRTLAGFNHPNIASLYTAFRADDQFVMVMEYVEGETLEKRAQMAPLPPATVVDFISQTLSALSYAHGKGVVHRDVKPTNLMVASSGVVKLMDFGIAKTSIDMALTSTSTTIGSFYYMSPEQINGTSVDSRSDLYSTGIVLYELLTGCLPFQSDSTYGVLEKQLHSAPQPPIQLNPALPPRLNEIILIALAKNPADRFQSADAFLDELKSSLSAPDLSAASGSKPAPPPIPEPNYPAFEPVHQPPPSLAVPSRRSGKLLWIATGALAAVLALVGVAVVLPRLPSHAATVPPENTPPVPTQSTPAATENKAVSMNKESTGVAVQPPLADNKPKTQPSPHPVRSQSQVGIKSAAPAAQTTMSAPPPGPSEAEIEQLHERFIQLDARARTVDKAISQIRSQQEANGLGLRNDIEMADTKLMSYMQAAEQNLQTSKVASAQLYLDKAEVEIRTLEKFLGR